MTSNIEALTIGTRIVAGEGDGHDHGEIIDMDGETVTVGWDSGMQTTTESLSDLRAEWRSEYPAEMGGPGECAECAKIAAEED